MRWLMIACLIAGAGGSAHARGRTTVRVHARGRTRSLAGRLRRGIAGALRLCPGEVVEGTRRLRRSCVGQFAAGLVCDGPRASWKAISRNPVHFVVGLCLTGLLASAGGAFGLPVHKLLVGASAATAASDVFHTYVTEYRVVGADARGVARSFNAGLINRADRDARLLALRRKKARIAGKMTWLPALVVATALAGGAVMDRVGHGPAGITPARVATDFVGGMVTGGDAPTAAVTTYHHMGGLPGLRGLAGRLLSNRPASGP